jgi:hypothetical protein
VEILAKAFHVILLLHRMSQWENQVYVDIHRHRRFVYEVTKSCST